MTEEPMVPNPADVSEEDVRNALRSVMDPELHLDVIALGLIESVDLDQEPLDVKMLLTTPFCPYGPWLVQQVKEAAEQQWSPELMEDPSILGFF